MSDNLITSTMNNSFALHEQLAAMSADNRRQISNTIMAKRKLLAEDMVSNHQRHLIISKNVERDLSFDWRMYKESYVLPLIYVLAKAFRTADDTYFQIYRDERLRFISQESDPENTVREIKSILDGDLESIVSTICDAAGHRHLRKSIIDIISSVHEPLANPLKGDPLKIALIGDCSLTEIRSFFIPAVEAAGVKIKCNHYYFSAGQNADINSETIVNALKDQKFDLIALNFLTFDGLPLYSTLRREARSGNIDSRHIIERCRLILKIIYQFVVDIREKVSTPILLHGCSGLPLSPMRSILYPITPMNSKTLLMTNELNTGLAEMSAGIDNLIFINEKKLVDNFGPRQANKRLLPRYITRKGLFHPSNYGRLLAPSYVNACIAYSILARTKVILVDFDNTLWKGVMAEGPVQHNLAGQSLLKRLKEAGLLLVSLSKNDAKSIRWNEMILKEDDFVLHKIGWNTKLESVLQVADQLNLNTNSFVLLDDNPVERDLIESANLNINTLDGSDDVSWEYLELLFSFPATRQTPEASRRTELYREAAARREAQSANVDYASMMMSLKLNVEWRRARLDDIDRLDELVNRTNQFNTTTIRFNPRELRSIIEDKTKGFFVATLADKFGSLGVVGCTIVKYDADVIIFESVVMSCRAMGFGLEIILVNKVFDYYKGAKSAIGLYIATERNSPCSNLFADAGFKKRDDGIWYFDESTQLAAVPNWLKVSMKP